MRVKVQVWDVDGNNDDKVDEDYRTIDQSASRTLSSATWQTYTLGQQSVYVCFFFKRNSSITHMFFYMFAHLNKNPFILKACLPLVIFSKTSYLTWCNHHFA